MHTYRVYIYCIPYITRYIYKLPTIWCILLICFQNYYSAAPLKIVLLNAMNLKTLIPKYYITFAIEFTQNVIKKL